MTSDIDELDRRVRRALASGDTEGATAAVIAALDGEILALLSGILDDRVAVEEAFGMFAEDLLVGVANFRGDATVRTWTYRVAYHAAYRYLRDPYRRRARRLGSRELDGLVAASRTPTPTWKTTPARSLARELRARLTPEQRALLVLRVDRGLPWRDIALIAGADADDARATKRRAAQLRKRFERLKARFVELLAEASPEP